MFHCVKSVTLLILCLLMPLSYAQKFPSKESANSEVFCKNEWTKRGELDQRMYQYCLDREFEGYRDALVLIEKYKNQPWIQDLIDFSVKEWTKRDIRQDSMVRFSLDRNLEGWEDMSYEAKQPDFNQVKANGCFKKWAPQYSMVSYCYKRD